MDKKADIKLAYEIYIRGIPPMYNGSSVFANATPEVPTTGPYVT